MATEKLFLNTLTFEYPKEPVKFYFSDKNDDKHKSTPLKSLVLVPKEVKQTQKFMDLFAGCGGMILYTSFDLPTEGFDAIDIDFNEPENENLIKRYYNRRLEKYFQKFDEVITTPSGITHDLQVWLSQRICGFSLYFQVCSAYAAKRQSQRQPGRTFVRKKY